MPALACLPGARRFVRHDAARYRAGVMTMAYGF